MTSSKPWFPVVAGMLCLGLGAGLIGVYGFFVEPLSREFDVGVAVINIGPVALLLVPGIVAPYVGKLADRVSVRFMVMLGATLAMLCLFLISRTHSLLAAGLLFLVFSLGITLYGPVVINGLLIRQYPGKEARALAIAAIGISIASAILPPLMGHLLVSLSWREALAILSVGVWLVLMLSTFLLLPDSTGLDAQAPAGKVDTNIYRRREFWLVGVGMAAGLGVAIVLSLVYPPHFVAEGYSLDQAGWFLAFAGMCGLTGKAVVAWIGDAGRAYAKWLAIVLLLLQLAGLGILLVAGSVPMVLFALAFLGFGMGAYIPMHPYLNSRYFDTAVISQVIGAQMPLFLPFGLIGAPLAGWVFDQTGSYDTVLIGLSALLFFAIVVLWRLPAQVLPDAA
jgi:cyanate permease